MNDPVSGIWQYCNYPCSVIVMVSAGLVLKVHASRWGNWDADLISINWTILGTHFFGGVLIQLVVRGIVAASLFFGECRRRGKWNCSNGLALFKKIWSQSFGIILSIRDWREGTPFWVPFWIFQDSIFRRLFNDDEGIYSWSFFK